MVDRLARSLRLQTDDDNLLSLEPNYRKSWAIVIGISDYGDRHPPCPNARGDAEAFRKLLEDFYSFDEVDSLYDEQATSENILAWLRDKASTATRNNDRVVFYFAGHGTTQKGETGRVMRGFLVPSNAKSGFADCIDMQELQEACGFIQAKHIFIILDCCFSGVAAITVREANLQTPDKLDKPYFDKITSQKAWQILTAGASDEPVADRGPIADHSPFTAVLLDGLSGSADTDGNRIVTALELSNWVKQRVISETARYGRRGQNPFYNYIAGSEGGDFVFRLPYAEGTSVLARSIAPPKLRRWWQRLNWTFMVIAMPIIVALAWSIHMWTGGASGRWESVDARPSMAVVGGGDDRDHATLKVANSSSNGIAAHMTNGGGWMTIAIENQDSSAASWRGTTCILTNGGDESGVGGGDFVVAEGSRAHDTQFRIASSGQVFSDESYNAQGADFSEILPAVPGLEMGDAVVIGIDGMLHRSTEPYQTCVAGVYSVRPGFEGGRSMDSAPSGTVAVALAGVANVKASAENGSIRPGDVLATGSVAGHAMRVSTGAPPGSILGMALESLDHGTGVIRILVRLR